MTNSVWNEPPSFNPSAVIQKITDCLRAGDADMRPEAAVALAAAAYWRKLISLRILTEEACDGRVQDDDTRQYLAEFAARNESVIRQASAQMGIEELQAAILGMKPDDFRLREMPPSIARLVLRLLDLHEGESLLCTGAGLNSFIEEACLSHPDVRLTVAQEDRSLRRILNIRAAVMGWPVQVVDADIFSETPAGLRADKIFLNTTEPVRTPEKTERLRNRIMTDPALRSYFPAARLSPLDSAAWAATLTALSNQSPNGKTIVLVSKSDLTEPRTSACREKLVREGRIEAVVALPEYLDNCHFFQSYLLVCREGNAALRMVDGSDVYGFTGPTPPKTDVKIPRGKTLTPENMETIIERLHQDGKRSRLASPEELATRGFSLLPDADYLEDADFVRNLQNVKLLPDICRIYRGSVTFGSEARESRYSEEATPFQYLHLKDVQGGILKGPLPYLQYIDKKQAAHCAKNGVLVMGKNAPLRVGVLELPENTQVLLGGNIYAMEITDPDFDPVYVMAYLQSENGRRQLKIKLRGRSAVQIIPIKALDEIRIPACPIEKQRAVAEEYRQLFAKRQKLLNEAEQIQKELDALPG